MEEKCFIILCWFLTYIDMSQPYAFICPLPFEVPSHFPPPAHPTPPLEVVNLQGSSWDAGGWDGKESAWDAETWVRSLDWEDLLEKETVTHSSILTWRISWAEEPGRLQFMGSERVEHNRVTYNFTSLSPMLKWDSYKSTWQTFYKYSEFISVDSSICRKNTFQYFCLPVQEKNTE